MVRYSKPSAASSKPNGHRRRKRRCNDPGPMVVKLYSTSNLVMGQVKILKQGEEELYSFFPSKELQFNGGCLDSADICDDDCVGKYHNTEIKLHLGPEPNLAPKPIRLSVNAAIYARSAFASSPSPSSLPFLAFCKNVCSPSRGVHDGAMNDLRRLLGLDVL
ncbi:hypothetical protein AAC387_Pa04g1194 [Persea americana]